MLFNNFFSNVGEKDSEKYLYTSFIFFTKILKEFEPKFEPLEIEFETLNSWPPSMHGLEHHQSCSI